MIIFYSNPSKQNLYILGVVGIDSAESKRFLTKGNQLLQSGQLADALTQYHAAIGKFVVTVF